jgi:hypothetical protein
MPALESVQHLLEHELQSLCTNCAYFDTCSYRMKASKIIVQCELYELNQELSFPAAVKGLCMNCCKVDSCVKPHSESGVWHCDEYV